MPHRPLWGNVIDQEPRGGASAHANPRLSRRAVLGAGVTATAALAGGATYWLSDDPGPSTPGSSRTATDLEPVYRYRLRTSTEGWGLEHDDDTASVGNDAAGWLLARGTGRVALASPRPGPGDTEDWTLSDRDNDDRLTFTLLVSAALDTCPLVVTLAWAASGDSPDETASSAPLTIPCGVPVDIDTWWDCRGTAPEDVLTRVRGISLMIDSGDVECIIRVRDVRQPPSTRAWGEPPAGVGRTFFASVPSGLPQPDPVDAYQAAVLGQLSNAHTWSVTNDRALHIGEWAWPKESRSRDPQEAASLESYTAMAEQWMRQADVWAIPYTPWGESGYWGGSIDADEVDYGSYPDASYFSSGAVSDQGIRIVDQVKPSAAALERHLNANPSIAPSINLVGMCFTYLADGSEYSATNIGERGRDYYAEANETVRFLYDRGYRTFRLAFRWDRVMRSPDASELDADEWGYVEQAIESILQLPDTSVIVDVHCGGIFWISPEPSDTSVPAVQHTIDGPTGEVTTEMFMSFWVKMSRALRKNSERLVYEIANEPRDSNPFVVRRYTQAVVSAVRADNDATFFLIPSYPYDNISRSFAETNQPFPWIEDPLGTRHHAYTLHHYMDYDQSGSYALSYADTLSKFL